jgi:beta-glucosidase
VTVTAGSRLLARFDASAGQWRIAESTYRVASGKAADALVLTTEAQLTGRLFGS